MFFYKQDKENQKTTFLLLCQQGYNDFSSYHKLDIPFKTYLFLLLDKIFSFYQFIFIITFYINTFDLWVTTLGGKYT